ncbi:hypothetical protein [Spirillospora albida]|uniref:hypothetical protein n=1 Tax=Spirillospora albida TaxID=58123 RepID=UPI00068CA86C|nr:hypothetical protein [Spirillospora albida]
MAKPFDSVSSGGEPVYDRPPVPEILRESVVQYLEKAPIVLSARGFDTDVLDPDRASNVPLAFHTDGVWVWPGAVGYYLKKHGVPPQPELLEHIKLAGFQVPEVAEEAKDAAVRLVTGAPDPAEQPAAQPSAPAAPPQGPPTPPPMPAAAPGGFPGPAQPPPYAPPPAYAPPAYAPPPAYPAPAFHQAPPVAPGHPVQPVPAPRKGRPVVGVIAVVVAIALLLGGKVLTTAVRKALKGDSSPAAVDVTPIVPPGAPGGSGPAAGGRVVQSLPDVCRTIRTVLPAKARGLTVEPSRTSGPDRRACEVQRLTSASGRHLNVEVATNTSLGGANDAPARAAREFTSMWENAGDPEYHSGRERLEGLGDEAFSSRILSPIVYGPDEASAKTYWLGGADIGVRKGNVTISITWQLADGYRARGRTLEGGYPPYATTKKEAVAVAQRILQEIG